MPPRATGSLTSSRTLARRIAYEREARGWKQVTLAKLMTDAGFEMTQSTISKFERDENPRRITVDELVGFAQVFGVREDLLLLPPEVLINREVGMIFRAWNAAARNLSVARARMLQAATDLEAYVELNPELRTAFSSLIEGEASTISRNSREIEDQYLLDVYAKGERSARGERPDYG